MRERLVAGAPDGERQWRELLGYLLEYHRREARQDLWRYFERADSTTEQLIADADCIGWLTADPDLPPRPEKKSRIWTFRFPEQETKLRAGKAVRADTEETLEIVTLDERESRLELKVGPSRSAIPDVFSLIPTGPVDDTPQREAIVRYVQTVIAGNENDYAAVTRILQRAEPRLEGAVRLAAVGRGGLLSGAVEAVCRLDRSHLVIQGPPGTGKTFTSAHAIVELLQRGKRVGVTSLSHKAINNLLRSVEEVARERGVSFRGVKKSKGDDQCLNGCIIEDASENEDATGGGHQLIAGTAWLFSRPEIDRQLDYLFVDEAGQVSLANVVAMGLCARNIVLVGDQMQLPQPVKGAHPGGSGVSSLDYLMAGYATVPADRGIFLERTWRMHPDLCRFVSDAFYEGRLEAHESTAKQTLILSDDCGGALAPAGLRFVPVEHQANAQKSPEEAERLDKAYRSLLSQCWVNSDGVTKAITTHDILVVSPYNMQVNLLTRTLPDGARVGTVDKFQGQEAAVVLISMASSSGEDIPRGIDFLFSPNRLNVAISRARCLAVIFASPRLLEVPCPHIEDLQKVNTLCRAALTSRRPGVSPHAYNALVG